MILEHSFEITFTYKGKLEKRTIWKMHVSYIDIIDFYRIPGKKLNYDIYKKDGVWLNVDKTGLSEELLQLVGRAIEEAEKL